MFNIVVILTGILKSDQLKRHQQNNQTLFYSWNHQLVSGTAYLINPWLWASFLSQLSCWVSCIFSSSLHRALRDSPSWNCDSNLQLPFCQPRMVMHQLLLLARRRASILLSASVTEVIITKVSMHALLQRFWTIKLPFHYWASSKVRFASSDNAWHAHASSFHLICCTQMFCTTLQMCARLFHWRLVNVVIVTIFNVLCLIAGIVG